MRQHLTHVGYSIPLNTLCINIFHLCTHGKCYNILHIMHFTFLHMYTHNNQIINFQMTAWSFRDALGELKVKNRFNELMLWSMQGLHIGDICFVEIQTTFKMHTVSFHTFLQFIKKGSFNPDNLPVDSYSHTTAILLASIPDLCFMDIECVGIGNII